jgi:pimeloyl-ACP methyl ester carboxylesterase
MFININGLEQYVSVHGTNAANPPLLLVGGAGLALSWMAPFFEPWEAEFRVVHWDQPGAGDTLARHGDEATGPITFERLAADGIAVADATRTHLGVPKLVLLGASGGSIVGLNMIKMRPDLFSAYVGTGQIVDGTDVTESKEGLVMTAAEQAEFAQLSAEDAARMRRRGDQRAQATKLYEQMRDAMAAFHARALGLRYAVPMFFLQGDLDRYTPTAKVAAFADEIVAPTTKLAIVEGGGHAAMFLRRRFLQLLVDEVKARVAA